MNRLLALLGAVVAVQGAAAQDTAATPSLPRGLSAPAKVLHYTRGAPHDFGAPEGGVAYQYGDSITRLTVYLYARDSTERGQSAADAIQEEVKRFEQVLEIERSRGAFDRYSIAFDLPDTAIVDARRPSGVAVGREVAVALRRHDAVYVSLYFIYAIGDAFVKIRGTVPESAWENSDVQLFAHELMRLAMGGAPCP